MKRIREEFARRGSRQGSRLIIKDLFMRRSVSLIKFTIEAMFVMLRRHKAWHLEEF